MLRDPTKEEKMTKPIVIIIYFNGMLVKVFDSESWTDGEKFRDGIKDFLDDMPMDC